MFDEPRTPLVVPEDWYAPELPPMPDEVAAEVVRFARWRMHCYAEELSEKEA